jgi:O-antigen/teichoic acid export membrane protein
VYIAFSAKALAEAVSFARHLIREKLADWQAQAWVVSAVLSALLLVSFIRFNLSFFQAQARYLFPALPPVAVALCLGLQGLAPKGRGWIALIIGVALLLALTTTGFYLWIVPQFEAVRPAVLGGQA